MAVRERGQRVVKSRGQIKNKESITVLKERERVEDISVYRV